jgi:hypothetical protein
MTILYTFKGQAEPLEKEIATFPEVHAWLWRLGVGVKEDDPQTRAWWAATYRKLAAGGEITHFRIPLSQRSPIGQTITFLGSR